MTGGGRTRDFDAAQRAAIAELCGQVIDLEAESLERVLAASGADRTVQAEVRRIVGGVASVAGFLERPFDLPVSAAQPRPTDAAGGPIEVDVDVAELIPSGRIGRYRIRGRLGDGGFADVLDAEQVEPFRRPVAIKLLRHPESVSSAVLARFERESDVLARLDHPGLVHVLDAGTTGADSGRSGVPYLVMSKIDGEPITRAADRLGLGWRERVRLMADVCDALAHAAP